MTELAAVALTLYGEARGESTTAKLAVASVIRNRVRAGKWGSSYVDVCHARKQFSCWNVGDPNREVLLGMAKRLEAGETPNDPALRECLRIASDLLDDAFPSTVGEARHYHAASMRVPPAWAAAGRLVARVGGHLFFAGVA